VTGLRRLGKRIVFALDNELFLILHLMIAGRLHWQLTLYRGGDEGFDLAEFANAWKDAAELVG
jgi:formamidopyrimidine-DNA glycosylase